MVLVNHNIIGQHDFESNEDAERIVQRFFAVI